MKNFDLIRKAKLIPKDREDENFGTGITGYTGLLVFVLTFLALGYSFAEQNIVGVWVLTSGLSIIAGVIGIKKRKSPTTPLGMCICFLFMGLLVLFYGMIFLSDRNRMILIKVLLALLVLLRLIFPLVRYYMMAKRKQRCTEGAYAVLNDGIFELEDGEVLTGLVELENGASYISQNKTLGYKYVYSYDGNRYIIKMSDANRNRLYEEYGRRLKCMIDPDAPECYYNSDVLQCRSLLSIFLEAAVWAAVAGVFLFLMHILMG